MEPIINKSLAGCAFQIWPVINEKCKIKITGRNAGYLIESLKHWLLLNDGIYKMTVKFDRSQTIAHVLISKPRQK